MAMALTAAGWTSVASCLLQTVSTESPKYAFYNSSSRWMSFGRIFYSTYVAHPLMTCVAQLAISDCSGDRIWDTPTSKV